MSSTSKKTHAERKYIKDKTQEHHNDTLIDIYYKYESDFEKAKSNKERGNLWKKVTDDYNEKLGCLSVYQSSCQTAFQQQYKREWRRGWQSEGFKSNQTSPK